MFKATAKDKSFSIDFESDDLSLVYINGEPVQLDVVSNGSKNFHILKDNKSFTVDLIEVNQEEKTVALRINNKKIEVKVESELDLLMQKFGMLKSAKKHDVLKSQMPGKVIKLFVQKGQQVKVDDPLLVLEAMKMENIIKSPTDGEIESINVKEGQSINKSDILVKFKENNE